MTPADRHSQPQSVNVLGTPVSVIDMDGALATIEEWIAGRVEGKPAEYICVRDVHGLMLAHRDPEYRQIHARAGMVTPDGMPLLWFARLAGHRNIGRVSGTDFFLSVCARSVDRRWRHYFYGSTEATQERLKRNLVTRFPGIVIAGSYAPPFRDLTPDEDAEIVAAINAAHADIVWVGLGSPKQEYWMAEHAGRLDAAAVAGIGAAFDFVAGGVARAPIWMQRNGLEWLHRLIDDPRRLWRRYLVVTPQFIPLALLQLLGLRRYPEPTPGQDLTKS